MGNAIYRYDGSTMKRVRNVRHRQTTINYYHQQWSGYPQSPIHNTDYPYQTVHHDIYDTFLYYSATPLYFNASINKLDNGVGNLIYAYKIVGGVWVVVGVGGSDYFTLSNNDFHEANNPIYTTDSLTTIYFAKTTTADQDDGIVSSWVRDKAMYRYDTTNKRVNI